MLGRRAPRDGRRDVFRRDVHLLVEVRSCGGCHSRGAGRGAMVEPSWDGSPAAASWEERPRGEELRCQRNKQCHRSAGVGRKLPRSPAQLGAPFQYSRGPPNTPAPEGAPGSVASPRQYCFAASHSGLFASGTIGRPSRYLNVVSSGATRPARAPASIAMLQIDMRPCGRSMPGRLHTRHTHHTRVTRASHARRTRVTPPGRRLRPDGPCVAVLAAAAHAPPSRARGLRSHQTRW